MTYTCKIELKLPSLNEYVDICRTNPKYASRFKRDSERDISWFLKSLPAFTCPVHIHFHWIEENKRRDYDNVAFAKKFILDALVSCGKLPDDNRRYVTGFKDTFEYGKPAGVILTIEEVEDQGPK